MKKLIQFVLVIIIIGLIGSCWFNQKQDSATIEPREVVDGGQDVLYPIENPGNNQQGNVEGSTKPTQTEPAKPAVKPSGWISQSTKTKLLFDAPSNAHFMISNDKQLVTDKTIQLDMTGDGKIETLTLGLDHPNGVRITSIRKGMSGNLMDKVTDDECFDDYGDLLPGYSIQVTVLDIDQIQGKEVVVSLGRYGKNVSSYIFYVDSQTGFHFINKILSKSAPKLDGNTIVITNRDGKKEQYVLYQRSLVLVIDK